MRELNQSEMAQVSGGILPVAAALGGAAVSGYTSYLNGDSWQSIAGSAVLGGLGGVAGGMAKITTGALRMKYAFQGGGFSVASGTFSNGQNGVRSISDMEKEPEQ
jgi:lactobin A/cerein 7B family class IIb bacteriocin